MNYRIPGNRCWIGLFSLITVAFTTSSAVAWVYPEHRDIAVKAVKGLNAERSEALLKLWLEARKGHEGRLSDVPAVLQLDERPSTIDFAAWTAIAGDHSCSPRDLIHNVLTGDWIIEVAYVTERLKRRLGSAASRSQRVNFLRDSDIELQRADPQYATRAGSNNVHFLVARTDYMIQALPYLRSCVKEGVELNAVGAYVWFHTSALEKAEILRKNRLTVEERSAVALSALADEAFALHFLEDIYAAGHVAGTWGNASLRKGTHDYYNETGYETVTWSGDRIVLLGDANMREEDAERAAIAARTSIEQLLDIASGKTPYKHEIVENINPLQPDSIDVCNLTFQPARQWDSTYTEFIKTVLMDTPIPGLAEGKGQLPRFRAELGPFVGLATGLRINGVNGGFEETQVTAGGYAGLEVSFRVGFGLDGVMNEGGDGLVFLDFGVRQDGASNMKFGDEPQLSEGGDLTSAIPGRGAYTTRIRMPFFLLPGDMILTAPILLFDQELYTQIAVTAGNGGLIPWQTGIATPIGRMQFVLGREIGVAFYGYGNQQNSYFMEVEGETERQTGIISLRSIQLDFPFFELRPVRSFSTEQSSSLLVQLYASLEIPTVYSVTVPDTAQLPTLKNIWGIGMRIIFDWRYYF